jgi:hypothetical protein
MVGAVPKSDLNLHNNIFVIQGSNKGVTIAQLVECPPMDPKVGGLNLGTWVL